MYIAPALILYLDSKNPTLAFDIGNYFFNGGAYDLNKARAAYEKALAIDPNIRLAHYQLGRLAFIRGDLTKAANEIEEELRLHPEIPNSYYVRGLIEGYQGLYGSAEKDFSKFIEQAPQSWAGYNDLAWVQAKQKKFQEARETVLLAFKRLPGETERNVWLWTSLGVASLNLKEYNGAEAAFMKARTISEGISAEYFWSAYPGNDPRGAEQAFKQFKATLSLNLALTHEKTGKYSEAKQEYYNYLALLPEGPYPQRHEIEQRLSALP